MKLSNTEILTLAFVPPAAEILEIKALQNNNMAWYGMANAVKIGRNGLYIGIALAALGLRGETSLISKVMSQVITAIGTTVSTCSAVLLFKSTMRIKRIYDAGGGLN